MRCLGSPGPSNTLSNLLLRQLIEHLKAIEHRTYLWLHLILDIVRTTQESTTRRIKNEIEKLLKTVNAAYERILERVEATDRFQAINILHIIVGATRPLTLIELNIAARIEEDLDDGGNPQSIEDLDLEDEGPFEELVRNRCGLLVTVINKTVYLLHQTVKEFLVGTNFGSAANALQSPTWFWKNSLVPEASSFVLARACITYLLFTVFQAKRLSSWDYGDFFVGLSRIVLDRNFARTLRLRYSKAYPLLLYAGDNWPKHLKSCTPSRREQMSGLIQRLCATRSEQFRTWFTLYRVDQPPPYFSEHLSDLVIVFYLGLYDAVRAIIISGTTAPELNSVLRLAARSGNMELVQLAIEKGAELDSIDVHGQTALILAVFNGYKEITRLLLLQRAGVNQRKDSETIALMLAAVYGEKEIAQLLFNNRANSNEYHEERRDELISAVRNGHEDFVCSFLLEGVGINSVDGLGRTVLHYAVSCENLEVYRSADSEKLHRMIQLLFEFGANAKIRDFKGRTVPEFAEDLYKARNDEDYENDKDERHREEAKERRTEILNLVGEYCWDPDRRKRKRSVGEDSQPCFVRRRSDVQWTETLHNRFSEFP
jgi:hypothetical protein